MFETSRPLVAATLCIVPILLAGCQSALSHEDLSGTWKGAGHTINSRGQSHTHKYLVLEVNENGLIEGSSGWELIEGPGGHDGDTPSRRSEERIIGVFVPDTGEIHLAEMEEHGRIHGTLLDERRIRMVLVQPGVKPVASTFILTKVEED